MNETLARRLWRSAEVIDRQLMVGSQAHRVVGIVADATLSNRADGPRPHVYTPFWQNPRQVDARLAIRVRDAPERALPLLVREVTRVDPDVPVSETMTLPFQIAQGALQPVRLAATVLGYAAVLAVLLCAVGLYATLAFAVARRTREIGVRLALGAHPGTIRRMILREGAIVLCAGVPGGLALAVAGSRLVRRLLYGPAANDVASYGAVAAFIFIVGIAAAWIPARRAASVMPAAALRHD